MPHRRLHETIRLEALGLHAVLRRHPQRHPTRAQHEALATRLEGETHSRRESRLARSLPGPFEMKSNRGSFSVMAGLVPAIHAAMRRTAAWMPGTRPGMTVEGTAGENLGSLMPASFSVMPG